MHYYGIDWLAMIMSLLTVYYVGSKKRIGFLFGVAGASAWIFTNTLAHIWPGIILNIVLLFLYARGFNKWKKEDK